MRIRSHHIHWGLTIAALTGVIVLLALGAGTSSKPTQRDIAKAAKPVAVKLAHQQAEATLKTFAARQVNAQANSVPAGSETCYVPAGQGTMGSSSCQPQTLPLLGATARSVTPSIHGLVGTDTSSYQSCRAAPRWVSFWIVKETEGTGYRDRCAAADIRIAKQQHQIYGAYDFMRATGTSAAGEAGVYISYARQVGAAKGLHVLDVEANNLGLSPATVHAYICDWVRRVHAAFGGQVVIYTGNWFWGPRVGGSTCGAVLWDSAYANYAQLPASWGGYFVPSGWTSSLNSGGHYRPAAPLWQYTDGAYGPTPRVNNWDTDAFFGTRSQLEQLAGLTSPCSRRTACRIGRRHARVHRAINRKCHGAPGAKHIRICRKLRNRNLYMHRYARRHHLVLVTR